MSMTDQHPNLKTSPEKPASTTESQLRSMTDRLVSTRPIPETPAVPTMRSKLLIDIDYIINNTTKQRAEVLRIFDGHIATLAELRKETELTLRRLYEALQQRV